MLTIAVDALYTTLRRRGTTRQLARALVAAVICALLLLPALLWYNLRFSAEQAAISGLEIGIALVYIVLCGWVAPCGVTAAYCLFTTPRDSNTAGRLQGQGKSTTPARVVGNAFQPPRHQPGTPAPFVYSADKPWGWLVYRNGKFTGQELALKRSIVSIGREEDNEVWLDDDTISRYHVELAWQQGQVYVTDNDSLNGVLINGQRIHTSHLLQPGEEIEIGGHRFVLKQAQPQLQEDLSDPLLPQIRRIAQQRSASGDSSPGIEAGSRPPAKPTVALSHQEERVPPTITPLPGLHQRAGDISELQTLQMFQRTPIPERPRGLCIVRGGEMAGRTFLLDRNLLTLGRSVENDIIIPDVSISPVHLQFSRQAEGDYVQDLNSLYGSFINGQPLHDPHLLRAGDVLTFGNVRLEYTFVTEARTTPVGPPPSNTPDESPLSFPFSLKLPSKMKEDY